MDVQTFFFRRSNINALGQARCWTNHLLWHHAAHTVDLFSYQCDSPIVKASAVQGPIHPRLGTFFRYFGDSATYIARYDDLFNDKEKV